MSRSVSLSYVWRLMGHPFLNQSIMNGMDILILYAKTQHAFYTKINVHKNGKFICLVYFMYKTIQSALI